MKTIVRTSGTLFPALLSDFFGVSPFARPGLFDADVATLPSRLGVNIPSVNIRETDADYRIALAAPGLTKKDFKVETGDDVLTVRVEKEETKEEKVGYTRKEYSFHSFSRSFLVPENAQPDNIQARYEDGILTLTLPKKEVTVTKAKKEITVK